MTAREVTVTGQARSDAALSRRPGQVAVVGEAVILDGWAARLLVHALGGSREELRRRVTQKGRVPDRLLADLDDVMAALVEQSDRWLATRPGSDPSSDTGTSMAPGSEPLGGSSADRELSTSEAADVIGCSTSYLRRNATAFGGRQAHPGSSWRFPADQVYAHRDRRNAA